MFDFVTKIGVTYFRFPSPALKKSSAKIAELFLFSSGAENRADEGNRSFISTL